MHEKLGHIAYAEERAPFLGTPAAPGWRERDYSEETAREIDCAVREIVASAFERALALLTKNRATLEEGARKLLERETLGEAELAALRARIAA
jgi:cell division protease FtsH